MADSNIFDEIKRTIESLDFGSVEVVVQDGQVTQISTRIIKKTNAKTQVKLTSKVQKSQRHGINLNFKY